MGDTIAVYTVTALGGLAYGLLLFTVAAGLALTTGVMNVMNLAHGAFYLAGSYLAYLLTDGTLTGLALALLAATLTATAAGAVLAVLMRPLAGHTEQAVVTLGLGFITSWIFTKATAGKTLLPPRPAVLEGHLTLAGYGFPVYHLIFIAVAALLAAALHGVLRHTHTGIALRATVDDPLMAAATGLNPARIRIAALACGTVLAVTAGVLGAPILSPGPDTESTVLTLSLIVVVLAGAGASIRSLLIAALGVGQVQNLGVAAIPALAPFILFLAVIAVLVWRGRPTRQQVSRA